MQPEHATRPNRSRASQLLIAEGIRKAYPVTPHLPLRLRQLVDELEDKLNARRETALSEAGTE
jgi:hypothetical protein